MKIQPFEQNVYIVSHNTLWDGYQSPGMLYNLIPDKSIFVRSTSTESNCITRNLDAVNMSWEGTYRKGIALQVKKDDELPHIHAWVLISL